MFLVTKIVLCNSESDSKDLKVIWQSFNVYLYDMMNSDSNTTFTTEQVNI